MRRALTVLLVGLCPLWSAALRAEDEGPPREERPAVEREGDADRKDGELRERDADRRDRPEARDRDRDRKDRPEARERDRKEGPRRVREAPDRERPDWDSDRPRPRDDRPRDDRPPEGDRPRRPGEPDRPRPPGEPGPPRPPGEPGPPPAGRDPRPPGPPRGEGFQPDLSQKYHLWMDQELDPELLELQRSDARLDRLSRELGQSLRRNLDDKAKAETSKKLREVVEQHFNVRQERRRLELRRVEAELEKLRQAIQNREEQRERIIEGRIRELFGEDLGF